MARNNIVKIICFSAMGLIFAVVLAANIVCGIFFEMITGYFHGSGITYDNTTTQEALEMSDALCRDITEESVILLKNEGNALPLAKEETEKINLFGWSGSKGGWIFGSDGSVNSNSGTSKEKITTLTDVFDESGVGYNKELTDMYTAFRDKRADGRALSGRMQFYMLIEPALSAYSEVGDNGKTLLENAKEYSDTAVIVIGRMGGEGTDLPFIQYKNTTGKYSINSNDMPTDTSRHYLETSTEEDELIDMVASNFDKVVVIVNTCNAMELGFLDDDRIDAAIMINGTGQSGAYAVKKVLTGEVNPSGRLVNTQPYDMTADPSYVNAGGKSASSGYVTYAEDIYVGYKWYETADAAGFWDSAFAKNKWGIEGYEDAVQYPFGYGKSYTQFSWEVESIEPAPGSVITADTEFSVKVRVTNTGTKAGKDVVQLYYTPPYRTGGIEKASVNLLDFGKTAELLPANLTEDGVAESQVIELNFTAYDMASYDCYDKNTNRNVGYELDRGDYTISLRTDAHNAATCENATWTYNADKTIRIINDPVTDNRVTNRFTTYSMITKQEDGSFAEEEIKAYANCAIDGSDADGADVVYLSRRDFASTFPESTASNRTGAAVNSSASYVYNGYNVSEMPTQGVTGSDPLYLYTTESGGKPSASQLKTGDGLIFNKELVMALGKDYDDPQWETLLNQMSADDLSDLIELGGYRTQLIESIGKKYLLENDGPAGLNRHIMETDQNENISLDRSGWTVFPMPSAIASSWNESMAYAFGLSVANEGIATGVTGWYAPGANMQRSPFGGRNSEYYSEDSLLSGIMAAETARGAIANGMNVYVKHLAVNETETNRTGLRTWLTEQALREIYLRPFEISVKRGGANGMMSAFNRLGNTWVGANHALMTEVLRDEWGFRGAVITDYYSGSMMSLDGGLKAGNDLWLTGTGTKTNQSFKKTDPVFMYCARNAAHNILYAHCNSYYVSQTHDSSEDYVTSDINKITVVEPPFPAWIFIIVGLDVVTVAGITVWTIFLLKKKKTARNA